MANDSDQWPYDYDRERGIFTPRDRRFLAGELDDELDANEKRQKRYRLRQRVVHAIQDLAYLAVMDTTDLFQIADEIEEGITPQVDPTEQPVAPDRQKRIERLMRGIGETIPLFYQVLPEEVFYQRIEHLLAVQAALDHYDETGRYGRFKPTVDVELVEEMSIDELDALAKRGDPPVFNIGEYPGWYEVLDSAGQDPFIIEMPGDYTSTPDQTHEGEPDQPLVAAVVDAIGELDDGDAAGRDLVIEAVADQESVDEDEAADAVREALFSGWCYAPSEGRLRLV